MDNMSDTFVFRLRTRHVGARVNALRFVNVKAQERGESKLKEANFYSLPPSNMRFLTDHTAWRKAWALACEESSGLSVFSRQNKAPLLVVEDQSGKIGPPTANLKNCYSAQSEFRARVTLDLDSDPTFKSDHLMDCSGMHSAICNVLTECLVGDAIQWEKERCVFFYGSTDTKERTGHLVFLDVAFRNTPDNAFKSAEGKRMKKAISAQLDEALAPFGVGSDMSIATSGLRYEFTDKLEKDGSWRRGVALPEACFNCDFEGMSYAEMICGIDPLVIESDLAWDRLVQWEKELEEVEEMPARKRQANTSAVSSASSAIVDSSATGTVGERLSAAFPSLSPTDVVCKQVEWREGVDLYSTVTRYCPIKQAEHSACGKVKIFHYRKSNEIHISCFPCESHDRQPLRIRAPQVQRQEGEKTSIVNELNERHFMAPMGTRGNNRMYVWTLPRSWDDDFRAQLPNEFVQSFSNRVHVYYDANDKRKKISHARMWLDSLARAEFTSGTMCAPMGARDGYFNTWRGFEPRVMQVADEIERESPEQLAAYCPFILRHLRMNICNDNDELFNFFVGWLQFLFTKLDKKSGVALVLSGEPGCGKSYFFEVLLSIVGMHHGNVTHDSDSMSAQFAHSKSADMRLEVFDEATTHGDQRKRGIINGLITSHKVRRERKFHDAETVDSFTNVIICSNYDHAVDAIVGARRFQCTDVAYRVQEMSKKEFFDGAHKELEDLRSLAAFYLLCRDHHHEPFHPLNVVQNESLWRNVFLGLQPEQKWWFNCLRYGELQLQTVRTVVRVTGDVEMDAAANDASDNRAKLWDALGNGSDVSFKVLRQSLVGYIRNKTPTNNEIEALLKKGNEDVFTYATRRVGGRGAQETVISLPTLSVCRANFARWLQFPADKIFTVWSVELK